MPKLYIVEHISAVRKGKAHVFWKGYDESEATWEPVSAVKHTPAYTSYHARKRSVMQKARDTKMKMMFKKIQKKQAAQEEEEKKEEEEICTPMATEEEEKKEEKPTLEEPQSTLVWLLSAASSLL